MADDMTYENFKEQCGGLICRNLVSAAVTPEQLPGHFTCINFPVQDLNAQDKLLVHCFDVIMGYEGPVDLDALTSLYKRSHELGDVSVLPPPFGLKDTTSVEAQLQFVVIKQADGLYSIFKHFIFPHKVTASVFRQMTYGTPKKAMFMSLDPKMGRKIIQYCLERMGGRCFKFAELTNQGIPTKVKAVPFEDKDDEDIDKGFEYLAKFGPRSAASNQQLKWMTKTLKNKDSPLYAWPQALVEKALRNLTNEGVLAKKEFSWPLPFTPTYYQPWLVEIMEQIWDFDMSAFVMLGEPGVGKSPLGRSVLMAQVRHNAHRFDPDGAKGPPCIRCTPEIDFLRGEPGSVIMGDFLDDSTLANLPMKFLKAFLDVGLYESMCWARWGATKWVSNEPRAIADNSYGSVDEEPAFMDHVPFTTFYDIVKGSFVDSATRAHMDAIFKRTCFLVNTKSHVYYRLSGINANPVRRVSRGGEEFLTEEGKKVYGGFRAGNKELPDNFDEEVLLEQKWIKQIMDLRIRARSATRALSAILSKTISTTMVSPTCLNF